MTAGGSCGPSRLLIVSQAEAEANSRPLGLRMAMMTLRLLEHWCEHLELDRDSALIVLATAAISMEKFTRTELDPHLKDIRTAMPADRLTHCNVSSIAAATGLNRETARRKVLALIELGILFSDSRGSIRLSADYTRRVRTSEMLRQQLETLVRTSNDLLKERIVECVPHAPGD
jgi:hypothetical protein